jgi:hypothetical protein
VVARNDRIRLRREPLDQRAAQAAVLEPSDRNEGELRARTGGAREWLGIMLRSGIGRQSAAR